MDNKKYIAVGYEVLGDFLKFTGIDKYDFYDYLIKIYGKDNL